ncbi:MAG: leucyl aminopeptidase family protein [Gammaproteobacteria bacterium]|jgi:leucyl aminopeptidase
MIDIPRFAPLRIVQRTGRPKREDIDANENVFVVVPPGRRSRHFRIPLQSLISRLATAAGRTSDKQIATRLDNAKATNLTVAIAPAEATAFERLTWARKLVAPAADTGGRAALLVQGMNDDDYLNIVEALLSALAAASFALPSFKAKRRRRRLSTATVLGAQLRVNVAVTKAEATGNNLARWLTALPPNMLDAAGYRAATEKIAATYGLEFEFLDEKKLSQLGAGAFLAVSQGNASRDAGIAKLSYTPDNASGRLALVGKGIVFDTGGNNIKPFRSMLDMHMDMQGSAVALGLLVALSLLHVPYEVETWLAITENRVSARAYKSQDVVTASNGTTIQVIHTDAEGRMVLADTLALAAGSEPDLIIDYATLTGTCVAALTSRYSGVFCNRDDAHPALIAAGRNSGERVWPFPIDKDFDEPLRSEIADIRQCSEDSSGDHILAARFLSRFVPERIPWLHVDLSAAQHKGGLAHIPSESTGFGVRFTLQLLEKELQLRDSFEGLFSR